MKEKILSFLSLFTSTATLFCCALPALIAVLAGGAAVSAYATSLPFIIPLSQHKGWIFVIAGILIGINFLFTLKPKSKIVCAVTGGKGCDAAGKFTRTMMWISLIIYVIGAFMAYGIVPIMRIIE